MLTRKNILFATFGIALAVRTAFAGLVSSSLFRYYHHVPGLDMQTLLRFSEWGTGVPDAVPFFSPHRILIYLDFLLHGNTHHVWSIFAVQALLGALGCAAIADLALELTGKRRGALATGILAALYLPSLIYEFSVLQDSFAMNLTLFAVWGTVRASGRRFAPGAAALCAVLWSLALAGRPTALLCAAGFGVWFLLRLRRQNRLGRALLPIALLAILLAAYGGFNRLHGWEFSPFYSVVRYTRISNSAAGNAPAPMRQVLANAVRRAPRLLAAYEVPENLNVYFWCEKLPILHVLPAPGALLPCACAALAILLISGAWKNRGFWVIAIPLLTLALPLCARTVIGRYRLMLTPYFFLAAAAGWYAYFRLSPHRRGIAALAGGAAAVVSAHACAPLPRIRTEDYNAWALAQKAAPGATPKEILDAFGAYWRAANFRSEKAFRATVDQALALGDLHRAQTIIDQARQNGISPDLTDYYRGWVFVLAGRPDQVEKIFSRIDPQKLPPEQRKEYFRVRDDTRKLLQKRGTGSIL